MRYWALSDPGCVRLQNQDAYHIEVLGTNAVLGIVCDGMGGAKSGNIASTLAVDVFVQEIKGTWTPGMDREQMDKMLFNAVKLTNFTVYDQAQQFEEFTGMGTTLVAVLVCDKTATVVNVGDSRAYCIDQNGISQLTVDHSVVQMMVARGEVSPEQAKTYPGKNLITRAVGTEPSVKCDLFHHKVRRGDNLVLCTDGLSNLMDEQEILFEVVHGEDKQLCCQRLLEIAKNRGAPDNVTSVVIEI